MAHHERNFTCGECKHFSTSYLNGKPYATTQVEGKALQKGVCRTNFGLILGDRTENDPCLQPEGEFDPISDTDTDTSTKSDDNVSLTQEY